MKGGRGQYSLEFLITYGWALLILGIVVGAIYTFGWIDPSNFMPQKCSFYGQVGCRDFYLSPEYFNLSLVNNFGVGLYIDGMSMVSNGNQICNVSNLQMQWNRSKAVIVSLPLNGCPNASKITIPGKRAEIVARISFFSNETCGDCWTHNAQCNECLHTATGTVLTKVSRVS